MPSPFPGMDPYLEGPLWPDVHVTLIVKLRGLLASVLPLGFIAKVDQYLWLAEEDEEGGVRRTRRGRPDVFVTGGAPGGAPVATTAPTGRAARPRPAPRRRRSIHLVDAAGGRLVTAIELLSPAEKTSGKADRRNYLQKRGEYLAAGANLIEIDLLRRGARIPPGEGEPPECDYLVSLIRADAPEVAEFWALSVRDPLPVIPVPLSNGAADVPLALRAGLDRAYDDADYRRSVDYGLPPEPPLLSTVDAEWAKERLTSWETRSA